MEKHVNFNAKNIQINAKRCGVVSHFIGESEFGEITLHLFRICVCVCVPT